MEVICFLLWYWFYCSGLEPNPQCFWGTPVPYKWNENNECSGQTEHVKQQWYPSSTINKIIYFLYQPEVMNIPAFPPWFWQLPLVIFDYEMMLHLLQDKFVLNVVLPFQFPCFSYQHKSFFFFSFWIDGSNVGSLFSPPISCAWI